MAFAFGIQYGLDDIRRANEAITRELEQQLAITQRLANESRMITGRSAYSLDGGRAVATVANPLSLQREQEIVFDRMLDRKFRSFRASSAGTALSRGLSTIRSAGGRSSGIAGNIGDIAQLASGDWSVGNVVGALQTASDITQGTRVAGLFGALGTALPALMALGLASGAVMAAPLAFAEAPKSVTDAIDASNRAFKNLRSQFKRAGTSIDTAPVDTGAIRGYNFDRADSAQGFYGRMELSAKLAKDVYEAASALAAADPKDAARFLNLPGQQSKSSIRYYIKQMLDQGTTLGLRLAANDMTKTLGEIKKREAAQAELFDRDPIMASKHQERLRAQKWEERQRAKDLRDWSRS
jgi:hypothetical protein